jgi:hypothetical protein
MIPKSVAGVGVIKKIHKMSFLSIYFWSCLVTSFFLVSYFYGNQKSVGEKIDYLLLFFYTLILLIFGPVLIIMLVMDKVVDICSTKK